MMPMLESMNLAGVPRDLLMAVLAGAGTLVVLWLQRWGSTAGVRAARSADRHRLRECLREARQKGDIHEQARCRRVGQVLNRREAGEQKWGVLAGLVLAGWLAWGGASRWGWLPVKPGEPVGFVLQLPVGYASDTVHVLPAEGVQWLDAPVQHLQPGAGGLESRWRLQLTEPRERGVLRLRLGHREWRHAVNWEAPGREDLEQSQGAGVRTRLEVEAYRPLGVIPARLAPGVPGWAAWWGVCSLATWLVWRSVLGGS